MKKISEKKISKTIIEKIEIKISTKKNNNNSKNYKNYELLTKEFKNFGIFKKKEIKNESKTNQPLFDSFDCEINDDELRKDMFATPPRNLKRVKSAPYAPKIENRRNFDETIHNQLKIITQSEEDKENVEFNWNKINITEFFSTKDIVSDEKVPFEKKIKGSQINSDYKEKSLSLDLKKKFEIRINDFISDFGEKNKKYKYKNNISKVSFLSDDEDSINNKKEIINFFKVPLPKIQLNKELMLSKDTKDSLSEKNICSFSTKKNFCFKNFEI